MLTMSTTLGARRGSMTKPQTTRGRRRHPSSRIAMLAVRVCLSGCMMPAAMHSGSEPAAAYAFERYEVAIGAAERQTVLTGFLSGGPVADLAAVYVDGTGDRRLRILAFADGDWSAAAEATLRPEVTFVDVADIDGRDRLIAYGDGRLTWFDPDSVAERELAAVTSGLQSASAGRSSPRGHDARPERRRPRRSGAGAWPRLPGADPDTGREIRGSDSDRAVDRSRQDLRRRRLPVPALG